MGKCPASDLAVATHKNGGACSGQCAHGFALNRDITTEIRRVPNPRRCSDVAARGAPRAIILPRKVYPITLAIAESLPASPAKVTSAIVAHARYGPHHSAAAASPLYANTSLRTSILGVAAANPLSLHPHYLAVQRHGQRIKHGVYSRPERPLMIHREYKI